VWSRESNWKYCGRCDEAQGFLFSPARDSEEFQELTIYAINILATFILERSHAQKQPVIVEVSLKSS
jgi:hypothetical protein